LKIAFIGAPSTGKSTLSARVAQELYLPHIEEQVPYAMADVGLNKDDIIHASGEQIVRFQKAMVESTRLSELPFCNFVADSALLEVLMYVLYFCLKHMPLEEAMAMYEYVMEYSRKYDIIFFLPGGAIPIVDNGFRNTHPLMNMAYDAILRRLIGNARKRGVNIKTVAATELNHRVSFVLDEVKRLGATLHSSVTPFGVTPFPNSNPNMVIPSFGSGSTVEVEGRFI
jgi:nicotinamide riboside kinase